MASIDRRTVIQNGLAAAGGMAVAGRVSASAAGHSPHGELWRHSSLELAGLIRTKQASCTEVMQAHLKRIRSVNPKVNAVGVVMAEDALRAAAEADAAFRRDETLGPLFGVPVTVKENIDVAGSATSEGVKVWRDHVVQEDAPLVAQLRKAGAIVVGRTNMPDFALRYHTESSLHGATINPWNKALTPGGSSGGDGVAVATGMVPLGFGNDFGGSLRWPAQCSGVTTIRPSRGRIARAKAGTHGFMLMSEQLFAAEGPVARRVSDLRVALGVVSGSDPRDAWWVPALPVDRPAAKPVKVALIVDPARQGVDPGVAEGVRKAARALEAAGYVIEEPDSGAIARMAQLWSEIVTAEMRLFAFDFLRKNAPAGSVSFLEKWFAVTPALDEKGYMEALANRNVICRGWSEWSRQYPLILGPVSTAQPFEVGFDIASEDATSQMLQSMRLVVAANLVGVPSVALPVGLVRGIPQAVQIMAPLYREDMCLEAAEVVEATLGVLTPINPTG